MHGHRLYTIQDRALREQEFAERVSERNSYTRSRPSLRARMARRLFALAVTAEREAMARRLFALAVAVEREETRRLVWTWPSSFMRK